MGWCVAHKDLLLRLTAGKSAAADDDDAAADMGLQAQKPCT